MKIARGNIINRFPEWCDGILIIPYAEGGEISDYLIYPVKKSIDDESYYFSDKWRRIEIPFIIELFDLAPCILFRNGEIYHVRRIWGFGKYKHIDISRLVGRILESGEVESEI